jgi:hypothetical protein
MACNATARRLCHCQEPSSRSARSTRLAPYSPPTRAARSPEKSCSLSTNQPEAPDQRLSASLADRHGWPCACAHAWDYSTRRTATISPNSHPSMAAPASQPNFSLHWLRISTVSLHLRCGPVAIPAGAVFSSGFGAPEWEHCSIFVCIW